jgi:endonuclease/exonuclease/phosphatase family metal-dependent hydrolase
MKTKYLTVFILILLLLLSSLTFAEGYAVPSRDPNNIVVASYNIKWFGQTPHDFNKLAEVIKNFDVCGIVEVKNESALAELVDALEQKTNQKWGYVFGIRTHRPDARKASIQNRYYEAYAVVWNKDRVQLGDGVISNIWDIEEAYRNDPFIVSFKSKNFDFILFLVHTRWGDDIDGQRQREVAMLPEHINWLRSFLKEKDFILAGDFNYDGKEKVMKDMAKAAGLKQIDPDANSTFKNDCTAYLSSYDHIYIAEPNTMEFIPGQCAVLDATKLVYGDNSQANMELSKSELSDHLPVWAIFDITKPDDD